MTADLHSFSKALDQALGEYKDSLRVQLGMPPVFDRRAYGWSSEWTFDNQLWAANDRHVVEVSTSLRWLLATPEALGWGGWRSTPWPRVVAFEQLERIRLRWDAARRRVDDVRARVRDAVHVLRHGMPDYW